VKKGREPGLGSNGGMDMAKRLSLSIAIGVLMAGVAAAASHAAEQNMKLSAMDIIDIQQLNARYIYAVDHCTNSGYDYADLYTDDGTFGVTLEFGKPGVVWAKGRDALAAAGGGGKDGCHEKKGPTANMHHLQTSLVITPTPEGAKGRSTLMAIGVGGNPNQIEWQGGYEDTYVKTPAGWRIKTRWHAWVNMKSSIQYKSMSSVIDAIMNKGNQ
jgi:hypothetical protein